MAKQRFQVLTRRLSFQRTDPDDPMVPVGDAVVVERLGDVPDWATTFLINALSNAGAIVPVGDRGPDPLSEVPAPPVSVDQPPVQPGNPGAVPLTIAGLVGEEPADNGEDRESADARPAERDSKAKWETYAVQDGVPLADAESMTKAQLIAEVERREAVRASGGDPDAQV